MEKQHKNLCMANVTCKIKGQPCPGTYGKCTCDEKEKPQECKCAYKHVNGKIVYKIPCDAHPENSWEILFDKNFVWEECGSGHFALFRVCDEEIDKVPKDTRTLCKPEYVKAFIRQTLTQEKQKLVAEIIKLSDEIEPSDTVFDEWRGFKQFRNALRDKYLK